MSTLHVREAVGNRETLFVLLHLKIFWGALLPETRVTTVNNDRVTNLELAAEELKFFDHLVPVLVLVPPGPGPGPGAGWSQL